jgi:hypothetical protein
MDLLQVAFSLSPATEARNVPEHFGVRQPIEGLQWVSHDPETKVWTFNVRFPSALSP